MPVVGAGQDANTPSGDRKPATGLLLMAAVALVAAVIGAGVGALVAARDGDGDATITRTTAATASAGDGAPEGGAPAERVYRDSEDAVVFITADIDQQATSPFGTQQAAGESTGTGFIVARDLVVTNAHVIAGATAVQVTVGDSAPRTVDVVGSDPSTDVALLRVTGRRLPDPLEFTDSDRVTVGESAYAIGNPYGLDRTLTAGVVSALQREITAPNGFAISGVIQTDAAINPGNSGGPLLDSDGEVIGITSQIISGSDGTGTGATGNIGIGFAVPSNTVKNVAEQLERHGKAEHAYLGVQTTDAPDHGGALVGSAVADSPAETAGLRAGDVIVDFGGERIASASDLTTAVNARAPGDRIAVTVRRDGRERGLDVRLTAQPEAASTASASP